MSYHTDIPDWTRSEAFKFNESDAFDFTKDYSYNELEVMMNVSPGLRSYDADKLKGVKVI